MTKVINQLVHTRQLQDMGKKLSDPRTEKGSSQLKMEFMHSFGLLLFRIAAAAAAAAAAPPVTEGEKETYSLSAFARSSKRTKSSPGGRSHRTDPSSVSS